jgi:hypothetical protein
VREEFKWKTFEDPPYVPELAPRDYLLFLNLKKIFGRPESEDRSTEKRRCAGAA